MEKFKSNEFWSDINKNIVNEGQLDELVENFRSSSVNYKISMFNPEINGVRFLKTLLYNLASSLSDNEVEKIKKVKNRNFGQPFCIQYNDEDIDLDYLQAVYEISFLDNSINLNDKKILEIGAGYGRTAHTILSNFDIKSYTIIDLKDTMAISQRYLKKVLPSDKFAKINFVSVDILDGYEIGVHDLAINIDSFAEMHEAVVYNYLSLIDKSVQYFYTKNPVGKYLDKSLDNHTQGKKIIEQALQNGILKSILNIDSNLDINKHSLNFVKEYKPSEQWEVKSESWAKPFSHYWQALYSKN
ncbi:conserved hypothetical protein [Arcobacter nitrofigilis DSM 7299]|uniref:Sugar O-methyltransferase n=1 Tax=Arcobacter nitrofigilis (strain ATCC 33309 / DSM 7299 / CCUG 15893 / LMG 7604 / NCTC 12251 / CI) TaxID=572480 RepID=D5V6D3_ARCNC|nr:putative sugar O-methyltransferase [Arcobacter nitrofigilis]ADG94203.1 conserved hypothetical protein [Arcobacter nitrofigilis DSM 7299]